MAYFRKAYRLKTKRHQIHEEMVLFDSINGVLFLF